jgi:hypothetical protein
MDIRSALVGRLDEEGRREEEDSPYHSTKIDPRDDHEPEFIGHIPQIEHMDQKG